MIHIGTSGFSYKDWVGPFYPAELPSSAFLNFYAQEFQTTEVNFTYYRLPDPRTLARMADKTPDGFVFTVKASKELTHEREDNAEAFPKFVQALTPLIERNKFGCVLAQFPWSFRPSAENRDYLRALRGLMADLPVVVEFRNAQWLSEETFAMLADNSLGFCCVDEPRLKGLIPPVTRATSNMAYVRFHGRNAKNWWQHDAAWERYDYSYSLEELQEWVPKIRDLDAKAEHTFLFANNHWQGQAVDTARQLRLLLF
ncbi:MAG: hypothetical protein AMJ93_13720 [Anaerolineae bacterium SM23_84]|nr:MAG: hypothetical protein AMJ93_13720 [Anaerolineae bacterium SM23_84]